jgi:hypothetical protein
MTGSSFPEVWPADVPGAVTWTGADLLSFALGWRSLLPDTLAREAARPHVSRGSGSGQQGLGWLLNERLGLIASAGAGPGASASLLIRADESHAQLALTNRRMSIEPLNGRGLHSWDGGPI